MFSWWKQKLSVEYGSLEQPNLVVAQSNSYRCIKKTTTKECMLPNKVKVIIHILSTPYCIWVLAIWCVALETKCFTVMSSPCWLCSDYHLSSFENTICFKCVVNYKENKAHTHSHSNMQTWWHQHLKCCTISSHFHLQHFWPFSSVLV